MLTRKGGREQRDNSMIFCYLAHLDKHIPKDIYNFGSLEIVNIFQQTLPYLLNMFCFASIPLHNLGTPDVSSLNRLGLEWLSMFLTPW